MKMNPSKTTRSLAASGVLALTSCLNTAAAAGWTTVPLGGGGFVTGLSCNANATAIYCRTDVGGAFRWVPDADATNGTWVSLTDAMVPFGTANATSLMGVEALSVDPSNLNRLYLAAGNGIWGSDDRGATWYAAGTPDIATEGNANYRNCGERLAVDPNNPDIVWYGSRVDGLQKGVKQPDGSWVWTVIPESSVPFGRTNGTHKAGLNFVGCDKNGGSTILYVGVFDNVTTGTNTGGVYRSTDGGTTWAKLPVAGGATLTTPMRAQVSSWGNVYITAGQGGAFKFMKGGSAIEKYTALPTGVNYVGVAADSNQGAVYVAEGNSLAQYNRIWRSTDGGANWTMQNTFSQSRQEPDGTKSVTGYWFGNTSSMLANPNGGNELWVADFFGVARTRNSHQLGSGTGANWHLLQKGQEETVSLSLKNGPTGPKLMSGVADVGGFRYNDVTARPYGTTGNAFNSIPGGNITSLDFSEGNTNVWAATWVESDGYGGTGLVSVDGGTSWTKFGELSRRTLYNGPTAGWESFDLGPYLAQRKALDPNAVVTLIVQSSAWQTSSSFLKFSSKEGSNAPQLLVNGATTLLPTEDAMAIVDNPTTNYGGHAELHAREFYGGSMRWSYIKFDLSTMPAISTATLRLYRLAGTDATSAFSTTVQTVDGNWSASTLNWNTRPLFNGRTGVHASKPPVALSDTNSAGGGRIAVSSTDPDNLVWLPIGTGTPAHYSRDRGITWTASTGGPNSTFSGVYTNGYSSGIGAQPLAADRVNGHFYIAGFATWDSALGTTKHSIYRSTDGGATWTLMKSIPNGSSNQRSPQLMASSVAGDLWLVDDGQYNTYGGGVWRSTDAGANWTKLTSAGKVTAVSFGKATTGSNAAYATYIYGRVTTGSVLGVHRSDNYGSTWTKLADPTINASPVLAGDRQNENSVFLGTGGRGVFHYTP